MKPIYWNKGVNYLSNKDEVLKKIIKRYPKENLLLNNNYFHSLINSIIGQQISVAAANSIKRKLFSLKKNITPRSILNINDINLRKCGLSRQKISYIKNISIFFIKNKNLIKNIKNYSNDEIKELLIQIKGIGNWTIDMFLIFSLGAPDVFPEGDLGFLKSISLNYKKKLPLNKKYLNLLKKKWSPYNSLATWYLWRSLDPLPVNY
tara:strand:- start:1590 stop:2207 length:618 start_codon:yes stop_codon:yes gene_type:complete